MLNTAIGIGDFQQTRWLALNRDEAVELVRSNVERQSVFRHMLAVEAIMKALAEYLREDASLWAMTGTCIKAAIVLTLAYFLIKYPLEELFLQKPAPAQNTTSAIIRALNENPSALIII